MHPKLLVLDIDGTIVKEHTNTVLPKVINALRVANDIVDISTMSARAWNDQKMILDQLGLSPYFHVVENGSKVVNPQGTIEYSNMLAKSDVDEIVKYCKVMSESAGCIDGKWIRLREISVNDEITTLSLISDRTSTPSLDKLSDAYTITTGSHWDNPDLVVTLISHKNSSKGTGVKYIQEVTGITPAETIIVGDGASDISAMKYAGIKIAMANAEDVLKEIADYVASSVEKNGVVDIVARYIK